MKIDLTGDYQKDSGIDSLASHLCNRIMANFFQGKDYGNNDVEIFMVIVCYPQELKLRKRYVSKESVLYWDVMLDYKTVKKAKKDVKKIILANSIIDSFDILDGYKKLNIDKIKLKEDAKLFFESIGWIDSSDKQPENTRPQ